MLFQTPSFYIWKIIIYYSYACEYNDTINILIKKKEIVRDTKSSQNVFDPTTNSRFIHLIHNECRYYTTEMEILKNLWLLFQNKNIRLFTK